MSFTPKNDNLKKIYESMISEAKDMMGKKCKECGKGKYKETSQMDDMNGVLHCDKCGQKVDRWKK